MVKPTTPPDKPLDKTDETPRKKKPSKKGGMKAVAKRIKENKARMLVALKQTLGVVTPACEMINISRDTFYDWLKKDPKFKADVDAMSDVALDFAENSLHNQIKEKSPAATIFYLKTKGKHRGYIEKNILTFENDVEINIRKKNPDGQSKD